MENYPTSSHATHEIEDLLASNGEELDHFSGGVDLQYEESSMANDEVQVEKEVASIDLTIEELESKLASGQVVKDVNEAYALYCKYASVKGFSVRRDKNSYYRDGSGLQAKQFVCSCEGQKDEKRSKNKVPNYQKTTSRSSCKALLRVARTKASCVWAVSKFIMEHTHDLYPHDQTYLLRSGRDITLEQQIALTAMVKSGITVVESIQLLENMAQGRDHVGFIPRDVYDFIRKTKIDIKDSLALVDYFKNKSNKEADFYWNMEVDDENRLMNFFFRDSRSLNDYMCFGDVLSFDTTYCTNKYGLVCAPFVGINHHRENIMFGLAFMSDETEKSFEWLFRTFLESMHDKQPLIVFTDQCKAMSNAIGTVFPLAHHRLCQWHVQKNTRSHFGNLEKTKFRSLWNKCMSECDTEDEFEKTWSIMMSDYDIGEKQRWFTDMYNLRYKWASVFSNEIFSAGLLATSRSEGTNAVLKSRFGNKTSTLLNCVMGYEDTQSKWRLSEKEKDTLCHHNKFPLFVQHPLLEHASNVYTYDMFKLFEGEFRDTMSFETPQQVSCGGSLSQYFVKSYCGKLKRGFVDYDSENMEIRCSCHKFETFGFLCSHALKVLDVMNIRSLPEKYIKKRWTKKAKIDVWQCESVEERGEKMKIGDCGYVSGLAFHNRVSREFHDIVARSKPRKEAHDVVLKYLECMKIEVDVIVGHVGSNDSTPSDCPTSKDNVDEVLVRDPPIAPKKTRGITNVNKRHWEDKSKKGKEKRKTENSRRNTKSVQQGSQQDDGNFPSQGATNVQQNQYFQERLSSSQFDGLFLMENTNHDLRLSSEYPNGMGYNFFI